jgi:hypothetical protein
MRHPFDGILPCPSCDPAEPAGEAVGPAFGERDLRPARRSVLGALAALVTGVAGGLAASARDASAQIMTTQALGEEGGGGRRVFPPGHGFYPPPGHGGYPPGPRWRATTQALGEEGGRPVRRWRRVTTQALGEEGGRPHGGGFATTEALGEEGGGRRWPRF